MLKASLSPFTNNWDKVHDFTPNTGENFEICSIDYGNIEQMNLVENLEKVKFTKELSLFPEYVNCKEFIEKPLLILCKQRSNESLESLFHRSLNLIRRLVSNGVKIVSTLDVYIGKGDMYALLKRENTNNVYEGRLIAIEVGCNRISIISSLSSEDNIEIIDEGDYECYISNLHRLAEIEMAR